MRRKITFIISLMVGCVMLLSAQSALGGVAGLEGDPLESIVALCPNSHLNKGAKGIKVTGTLSVYYKLGGVSCSVGDVSGCTINSEYCSDPVFVIQLSTGKTIDLYLEEQESSCVFTQQCTQIDNLVTNLMTELGATSLSFIKINTVAWNDTELPYWAIADFVLVYSPSAP